MPAVATNTTSLTLTALRGDAKTLLVFNLPETATRGLAGFTIECRPEGRSPYYLHNSLRFAHPGIHAQDAGEPSTSTINAPIHKFRWLHVPGSIHQGVKPFYGPYTYVVTPRYFDTNTNTLLPLDRAMSHEVTVRVEPFVTDTLSLRFTRGFVQSQGFVNHFGPRAIITPPDAGLMFDTSLPAGTNAAGHTSTFEEEYEWLGFTARTAILELLQEVVATPSLHLDMLAYDLDEPQIVELVLQLAAQGRVRIVVDDARLHHHVPPANPTPEDEFEGLFTQRLHPPAAIKRGHFETYAHDKVMIVSDDQGARTVLTGSTNFSITGLYVNSNHVLRFDDRAVASTYLELFNTVWDGDARKAAFLKSQFSTDTFPFASPALPRIDITFAPHSDQTASDILNAVAARIEQERAAPDPGGSVLFAMMQTTGGESPVWDALNALHATMRGFSYGISDRPDGIALYTPGKPDGVIVTGKPARSRLPRPFSDVPSVGRGHQIHHKFVVCGLRSDDPVVYCGSSNFAVGGEERNGDNLIEIHDRETVTAFAIEALALVDHFQFLNRAARDAQNRPKRPLASRTAAAEAKEWFLSTSDGWAASYYDPNDLHFVDRELFAALPATT
ncbi:MAG TPA: phospholipase D-like domain-containing protein [Gaiellales bacterium]